MLSEAKLKTTEEKLKTTEAKLETTKDKGLKILTSKQIIQRLPVALAQIKARNNSESLLNEISQIDYSLYQSKEITKKYIIT